MWRSVDWRLCTVMTVKNEMLIWEKPSRKTAVSEEAWS